MPNSPPFPANESARLAYLRACEVLDTPPEPAFDAVAELAARIFDVPTAFVNLIDARRQWFKASIGLDFSGTPRDVAFCAYTINGTEPLVIPNAAVDGRFSDNPLVAGPPHIRFYAGAPLVAGGGYALGTVGLLDNRPRSLAGPSLDILRALAREATALLEQRKASLEQQRALKQHADAAIRETDAEYRAIVENSTDLICQYRSDGTLTFVNPACCRMFGRSAEELLGRRFTPMVPEEDRPLIDGLLASLRPDMPPCTLTHRVLLPDGSVRWCQWTHVAVANDRGEFLAHQAVGTDITELRNLEGQLRQTQKLESIGRLAAGVAHDFNNLLTVIEGNVSLLDERLGNRRPESELLAQVAHAASRAASLTRQLLLFSRKERMQRSLVNLDEHVGELARMLTRILGEDVRLELRFDHALPPVPADPGMIDQVVTNLVVNARDAMPRGGVLRIDGALVNVDADQAEQTPEAAPGRYVRLSVSDTGTGIPPEVLPHIFDPFFTTKEAGRGTGLGLSTLYGIVAQHDGWVEVDTARNQGTTFRVFLPAPAVSVADTPEKASRGTSGGTETVLVVEDEPGLLSLVVRILAGGGYTVLTATNATEGLEKWRQHRGDVDLLLTDEVLTGNMRGHELAAHCRREEPGLPFVLMSGYAGDAATTPQAADSRSSFLEKPFRPAELLRMVRSVLDAR